MRKRSNWKKKTGLTGEPYSFGHVFLLEKIMNLEKRVVGEGLTSPNYKKQLQISKFILLKKNLIFFLAEKIKLEQFVFQ